MKKGLHFLTFVHQPAKLEQKDHHLEIAKTGNPPNDNYAELKN